MRFDSFKNHLKPGAKALHTHTNTLTQLFISSFRNSSKISSGIRRKKRDCFHHVNLFLRFQKLITRTHALNILRQYQESEKESERDE